MGYSCKHELSTINMLYFLNRNCHILLPFEFLPIMATSGLDVATCGVANATGFYSVATNFSYLVTRLAPEIFVTFFGKTYSNNIPLSKVK